MANSKEDKKNQLVSVKEFMRIEGCGSREKFAAEKIFGDQKKTRDDWNQEFQKNKLK